MLRSVLAIFVKPAESMQLQVEGQKEDFIRLGVLGDWDDPYLTMAYRFEADIVRALAKIIDNGHYKKGLSLFIGGGWRICTG